MYQMMIVAQVRGRDWLTLVTLNSSRSPPMSNVGEMCVLQFVDVVAKAAM